MTSEAVSPRRWSSTFPVERGPLQGRPRLAVLLYGQLAPGESQDRWLIQVRWLAILGMGATILVASRLVPALRTPELIGLVGSVALANVGWTLNARREGAREQVAAQLVVDVVLLWALLWFSGGLDNPFTVFLTFQIALAGVLCEGRVTLGVGVLAVLATVSLSWAPALPLAGALLGRMRIEALGRLASLISLCVFLGLFALVYARRLADLRQAKARNERLAMLGRLVGGMSHELATPLGTIVLGSRDLVDIAEGMNPEAAELARTIASEAERASDIIGLLRGHLRPDQRAERVDLSELVKDLMTRELDRLSFRGTRVLDAPRAVHATVFRVAVAQVLRNLLANAVHATGELSPAGRRRIEVVVTGSEGAAEIQVIDNGPGFSPEIAEHLGEPFQTTKEGSGGLGLGLYVSSMLAQQMRATLRVEDVDEAEGGGARVTLVLDRSWEQGAPRSVSSFGEGP